jgi:hypothetical protein
VSFGRLSPMYNIFVWLVAGADLFWKKEKVLLAGL